jgi:RNAse (barnase) inhibitor barstar
MYRTPELKIEIKQGMGIDEIHSLLSKALEFPDYSGKNWDAFEDCFNDDEASNPPEKLIVEGWNHFVREHLADAKIFWACIEERAENKKPTQVFVVPRACPCCGYLTLSDWTIGSWEICEICNWEDDAVQFSDPAYEGGANIESLLQAQERFSKSKKEVVGYVREFRGPNNS